MRSDTSIQEAENQRKPVPRNINQKILFAVREGNLYQAKEAMKERIEKGLLNILSSPLTEWKFYLVALLTDLNRILEEKGAAYDYVVHLGNDFIIRIDRLSTVQQAQELMEEIIVSYTRFYEENSRDYPNLVKRVIEQVEMDLCQQLTLQYFARMLNVNSSYLSNLFRQSVGITITDYVTGKRISHAAMMLIHSKLPVKQVARQSGIPDVQYFSRLFKRRMGITPTDYRLMYTRSFEESLME